MEENRDPKTCPSCETVNVWNAETCRSCGGDLTEIAPPPPIDEPDIPPPRASHPSLDPLRRLSGTFSRRRWNMFWIILGIGLHVVSVHLGVFGIIKYLIDPDPELKGRLEQTLEEAQRGGNAEAIDIAEGASEAVKSKLSTIRFFIVLLLVFMPILIGMIIGFYADCILEGAASMGVSAVLIPLLSNAAEYAVFWGPVNAGFGALGAFLGYHLRRRLMRV